MSRNQLTLQPARLRRGLLELGDLIPALPGPPNCEGYEDLYDTIADGLQRGDDITTARAICAACPVNDACYQQAVDRNERHGMWGGVLFPPHPRQPKTKATARPCNTCQQPVPTPNCQYCDQCRPTSGRRGGARGQRPKRPRGPRNTMCTTCGKDSGSPQRKYCDGCRPKNEGRPWVRKSYDEVAHGQVSGSRWHERWNVPKCQPCRDAVKAERAARKAARA
jgi:hypothetical protein